MNENNSLEKNLHFKPEQQGWVDVTEQFKEKTHDFIAANRGRKYDSLTEFHLSGMNSGILSKISEGSVRPKEIQLFYKDGKPEQIHAWYDGQGLGHNLDFYISGKALEDFFILNELI